MEIVRRILRILFIVLVIFCLLLALSFLGHKLRSDQERTAGATGAVGGGQRKP